jgi:hypothetical protein
MSIVTSRLLNAEILVPTTSTLFRGLSEKYAALQHSVFRSTSLGAIRRFVGSPPHLMTTAAMSDALRRLQDRASPTRKLVEVPHTPQPEWPLRSIAEPPNCLRLSVLDSSFNQCEVTRTQSIRWLLHCFLGVYTVS